MFSKRVFRLLTSFELGAILLVCSIAAIKVIPYLENQDAIHVAATISALCVPILGLALTTVAAFTISQYFDWNSKLMYSIATVVASIGVFSLLLGPLFVFLGATPWQFVPYCLLFGLVFGLFSISNIRLSTINDLTSPLFDENASLGTTFKSLLGVNSKDDEGALEEDDDGFDFSRDCSEGHSVIASGDESPIKPFPQWGAPQLQEYVLFGRDHGGEPLKWIILGISNGKTCLLSDKILDICTCRIEDLEEYTYEDSDIEEYIADELVYELFERSERAYLEGKPRILSAREAERLFPRDADRIAYPTAYARTKLGTDAWDAESYWLSTPGEYSFAYVRPDGDINEKGYTKNAEKGHGIRLFVTLNIDARKYSRRYHPADWEEDATWMAE